MQENPELIDTYSGGGRLKDSEGAVTIFTTYAEKNIRNISMFIQISVITLVVVVLITQSFIT